MIDAETTVLGVVRLILVVVTSFGSAAQTPSPYASYLSGKVFTSPYFGFSYRFPEQLVPNDREMLRQLMKQHAPSSTNATALIFSAYEPPAHSSKRRLGVMIDVRKAGESTAKIYAEKLNLSLKPHGWIVVREPQRLSIAGLEFYRLDYSKQGAYESSICTVMKGYVLEFLLSGGSQDDLQLLSNSLKNLRFERTAAR